VRASAPALIILTGLVIWLVVVSGQEVTTTQQNAISSCEQSNQNRLEDIAIWNTLLDVSPATPAARAEVVKLKHLVQVKDTPHVCR
jgi:16S rRNA U1498 N3-methylase RsmE